MLCRKCQGNTVKTRWNYSHGRKSRPTITQTCRTCGSMDIESRPAMKNGRKFRRR